MWGQIGQLVVETVAGFLVYLLLARFHFQWLRVSFRNPIGEFVVATTNWLVVPLRRLVPSVGGFDVASLAGAWVVQLMAIAAVSALRGRDPSLWSETIALSFAFAATVDLARASLHILVFALIVQAALSWISPYHPMGPFFDSLTRRFLQPLRRLVPPVGNVDLTPLVLLLAIQILLIPLGYVRSGFGGVF